MIITSAGKRNLQSTSRQNDLLFCLMISSWGVYATKLFFFYFNIIPTFKWSMSLLLFWLFLPFACSRFILPFGGHLSTCILVPVGASDCWLVSCCVLSIMRHTRGARLLILFCFLTAVTYILCAFAVNASPCAKWGPPWIVGPYGGVVLISTALIILWWIIVTHIT